jgi:carboxyl-terminal processing protease
MHANSIYAAKVNWAAVRKETARMAAGATTVVGTYAAISYAIGELQVAGDLHADFFPPGAPSLAALSNRSPEPTVHLVASRIGSVSLPMITTSPTSPNSLRYVQSALRSIAALNAKHHPCGWVIDLRNDSGGDMYPMLLSVGPILGAGKLIGFTGRRGFEHYVSYRNSTLSGGGFRVTASVKVPPFSPAPPVAVLIGPNTASSGEAVTVAFRGRPSTRSFGAHTFGATNSPQSFPLSDRASLLFSVAFDVDRNGTVYRQAITPDQAEFGIPASVEKAAQKWLLRTTHCTSA